MGSRGPQRTPTPYRFWTKVACASDSSCWEWIGAKGPNGYGVLSAGGHGSTSWRAHRAAYELLVGPIGGDLTIDHLCGNRSCVNPDHMEPVTRSENSRRGAKNRWPHKVDA